MENLRIATAHGHIDMTAPSTRGMSSTELDQSRIAGGTCAGCDLNNPRVATAGTAGAEVHRTTDPSAGCACA